MSSAEPTPELYFDTIFAFQRTAALKTAIDLELFTAIKKGAHTSADLAKACGAPERAMRILCDFLTTIGFLTKSGSTYDLTLDTAVFLTKDSQAYLGGTTHFLASHEVLNRFSDLTKTIRTGPDTGGLIPDEGAWVKFAHAMVPMMVPSAMGLADILNISSASPMKVLDIAASHGIFGIVLAQRNSKAEIVAVDAASVLEVATDNAKKMGVGDRHKALPGDAFVVDFGTGYDLVLVTNFLHHFDWKTNVDFLKKTAACLKSGGQVAILEFVPNDDRISPPMAARFSLSMLGGTPSGDAYTFKELKGMLEEAGFRNATQHPLPGPQSWVIATK